MPSRRTAAPESTPNPVDLPRRTIEREATEDQELDRRYTELRVAVTKKRRLDEIQEMEDELAGRTRSAPPTPASRNSSLVSIEHSIRARAMPSLIFTAQDLEELRKYI